MVGGRRQGLRGKNLNCLIDSGGGQTAQFESQKLKFFADCGGWQTAKFDSQKFSFFSLMLAGGRRQSLKARNQSIFTEGGGWQTTEPANQIPDILHQRWLKAEIKCLRSNSSKFCSWHLIGWPLAPWETRVCRWPYQSTIWVPRAL